MLENFFTNKCMALVDGNGRALTGDAVTAAEKALCDAREAGYKIWINRKGFYCVKERKLFAKTRLLCDSSGTPLRSCGKQVNIRAKFCSRCGSPAPGGWWRCGGCGTHVGNESQSCPNCGRKYHPDLHSDLAGGNWNRGEDVFAEQFEFSEFASMLDGGLNVQENQFALLLEGGAVTKVLRAGYYPIYDLKGPEGADRAVVMVQAGVFKLPIEVPDLRSQEDLPLSLRLVANFSFDPENAGSFIRNLMGNCSVLRNDVMMASLLYDEVAFCIAGNIETSIKEFCSVNTAEELCRSKNIKAGLEKFLEERLRDTLHLLGLNFSSLISAEVVSDVYGQFREWSGEVEKLKRDTELFQRENEVAAHAAKHEAETEYAMNDYMKQLEQEKIIKDHLRTREIERMNTADARAVEKDNASYEQEKEKNVLNHEHDLDDMQQLRQLSRDMRDEEFSENVQDLRHSRAQKRRMADTEEKLSAAKIDHEIQGMKLDDQQKSEKIKTQTTEEWLKLKMLKQSAAHTQKIELLHAASQADIPALLSVEPDPGKREDILRFHEQDLQSRMTPELLLAAAAARGNAAAAEALNALNQEQLAAVERSKSDNRELYEQMLRMSERMFDKTAENLLKKNDSELSAKITITK